MEYGLITPEIELQTKEILGKIRMSMNGVASEQMSRNGILYKKNYGVSVPRLKEIAADYQSNPALSQHLWKLSIRETMILATMLQATDRFTKPMAEQWILRLNQIEIIEQINMNLLQKLPYAATLCCDCIGSENEWTQTTGFILGARIYQQLTLEEVDLIVKKGLDCASKGGYPVYKSVALCLSRLCRKDTATARSIQTQIQLLDPNRSVSDRYIQTEVEQELLFLEIL